MNQEVVVWFRVRCMLPGQAAECGCRGWEVRGKRVVTEREDAGGRWRVTV